MRNHLFKHKKSRSMKMFLFTLCILFVATNIQNIRYGVSKPPNDLAGVKVAVYNGSGALESSYDALVAMFEWMNATVNSIDSHAILNGNLSGYDFSGMWHSLPIFPPMIWNISSSDAPTPNGGGR